MTKNVVRKLKREKLVVTIAQEGVYFRQENKRTTFGPVAWGTIFLKAAQVGGAAPTRRKRVKRGFQT